MSGTVFRQFRLSTLSTGGLVSIAFHSARVSNFVFFGIPGAVSQVSRDAGGRIWTERDTQFFSMDGRRGQHLLSPKAEGGFLTPEVKSEDERAMLTAGMLPHSSSSAEAQGRAVALLSQQVRAQAYTLATSDGLILITWVAVSYLLLMLFLRPGMISYMDLNKMP